MYCKHCGQQMDDGAEACPNCGMSAAETYCVNCGAKISARQAFCGNCGFSQNTGGPARNTSVFSSGSAAGKELHRSSKHRIIAGVCGGLGETADCNPWIFRAFLILSHLFGIGILLDIVYIIMIFALPQD